MHHVQCGVLLYHRKSHSKSDLRLWDTEAENSVVEFLGLILPARHCIRIGRLRFGSSRKAEYPYIGPYACVQQVSSSMITLVALRLRQSVRPLKVNRRV